LARATVKIAERMRQKQRSIIRAKMRMGLCDFVYASGNIAFAETVKRTIVLEGVDVVEVEQIRQKDPFGQTRRKRWIVCVSDSAFVHAKGGM